MYVALRDLRFAKGRFMLMGAVVALITLLVVFLSGLTAGLGRSSTSAVSGLPAQRFVFGAPAGASPAISFSQSSISSEQFEQWQHTPGVGAVYPLGVAMTRLSGRGATASVSVLGGPAALIPPLISGSYPAAGQVVLSGSVAASLGVMAGDEVTLGPSRLTVSGLVQDRSYGHATSVWTSLGTWSQLDGAGSGQFASALVVVHGTDAGINAAATRTGTVAVGPGAALAGIDGYSAEHGSLLLIQAFLFVVSALVIGAFFTVWTMQRKPDVAVLKALGGSNAYLLRDALVQAVLVLCGGAAIGGGLAMFGGSLAAHTVPFVLSLSTTVVPMGAMVLLGAVGAALAIRRITAVDPLTALGGAR